MSQPITSPESNKLLRSAVWVAIGALIAVALVCVVWVLVGDEDGIIGKAFLTVLLLASFAGLAIVDSNLAARRPAWVSLASMASSVVLLLVGALLIWMPSHDDYGVGFERFFKFILIVLIVQGALLHVRLYVRAFQRRQTTFTTVVAYVTIALVVILMLMLVLPLVTEEFVDYRDLYWRVVVAIAILAAVGTALLPLVNALFAPKRPRAALIYAPTQPGLQAWPTYADGVTALPVLPDGTPDWNAYYTGYPTYAQPAPTAAAPASAPQPAAPEVGAGYQGYPSPPPMPPQPQA